MLRSMTDTNREATIMKRIAAILLALVMTLGLTTVGANAATYSDADSINYKLRMSFA